MRVCELSLYISAYGKLLLRTSNEGTAAQYAFLINHSMPHPPATLFSFHKNQSST
jgi:hypothetical protein